ncbi:MAG: hypothetical protein RIS00_1863, partial [Pseudomonadota bacterium]
ARGLTCFAPKGRGLFEKVQRKCAQLQLSVQVKWGPESPK